MASFKYSLSFLYSYYLIEVLFVISTSANYLCDFDKYLFLSAFHKGSAFCFNNVDALGFNFVFASISIISLLLILSIR